MPTFFRGVAACLLALLLLWSLCSGIFNGGLVCAVLYSAAGFFFLFFPRHLIHPSWGKLLFTIGWVGYVLFTLCALFLFGWMLSKAIAPLDTSSRTVIVLGCQVQGQRPSKMLAQRLDSAYEYLLAHPDSPCVLSGGQGDNEELPEAVVMKQYLVEKGVSPERLFTETRSQSTSENLLFSSQVIRQERLSTQVVIVTNGFHQLRGQWFAEKNGLSPQGLSCHTSWNMLACYYVREILAVGKMLILGS